ncbi:hypothetical protein [Paenibacillus ginsengarvi]|uniref:DUF642 domain-containing protein n=1 Tax=Paenibacillus ginsengarvi TaxID=400777 RepID=A0A3B0CMP1_9BACL|nr:hypothetical protein [Paenibacillus ginsengarvi]RKN86220.1 hypothetical protein D7M11_04205 [Paenibacillus ginsengarvi]
MTKKSKTRILAFLLCISLVFGMIPLPSASAAVDGAGSPIVSGLMNPGFEMNLGNGAIPGWTVDASTAANGSIEISSARARSGSSSLLFQDKVSGTSPNGAFRLLSNSVAASAGDTVTFDVYVYKGAAADQTAGVQPVIHYYTAAGVEITPNAFLNYGNTTVPVGSWYNITVNAKAPANTAYIKVGVYSGSLA